MEHCIIAMMPLMVMCDRWDIGGVSFPHYPANGKPTIFIYDSYQGGIGLSEKAFDLFGKLVNVSYELVRDCPCEKRLPARGLSPKCGNDNQPLDKSATKLICIILMVYLNQ
ncbi:MAG: Zn-binding domain-containing protein [Actinomycetota bacterium]|nr:Zn-binding domain-containing protein [Actinomycetota bacterium]